MSFVTAKSLPRRTVLRGLGVTMALPFLEAMIPALSVRGRAAAKPLHRFQTFYVPNGMAMEYWTPAADGRAFELSPVLEPLAPFREQLLVLSGLKASWNYIHAGASGSFLTGTSRGGRNEVEIIADVSMDQLLARQFARETQVASLEVAMDAPANAGACTGNLSCAYTHTISWRSPSARAWCPTASTCRRSWRNPQKGKGDCSTLDAFTEKKASICYYGRGARCRSGFPIGKS